MSDVQKDFTTGSISKKLIAFMIPILGSLILQAMYGAVDLLVVGRFGTKAGLSGVSTGSGVINLATYVIIGLAMDVTVLIGRYIGQKEQKKSERPYLSLKRNRNRKKAGTGKSLPPLRLRFLYLSQPLPF